MYINSTGAVNIGADPIYLPGYSALTPGSGGAFGGPQNILQFYEDMTYTLGSHTFRFGGTYENLRDNRTFAAYQTGVNVLAAGGGGLSSALSNMIAGQFSSIKVAVDPQGQFPGGTVQFPLGPPNFSRSNRYNDGAAYIQGSSADLGAGDNVNACSGCTGSTYDRRNLQLAIKLTF